MLILAQRPDATRAAGYRTWQRLGRQVRTGAKGIAIFAPCVYRRRVADEGEAAERPELVKLLKGFTVVHVFDEADTDGEDLDDVRPVLLDGEGPDGLWAGLAAQVTAAGYRLERRSCHPANGRTDFGDRTVVIDPGLSAAQATKTLCHELAHVLLHDASRVNGGRDLAEVEAESVAFIVCHAAGMTTGDYSLPYVARWSGGDPALVRTTAERVIGASHTILDAIVGVESDATAVSA